MSDNQKHYDLVVIGGGPAGTPVAMEYAKLNKDKKVALIDTVGKLGGECLFQGCIPSKIMEASAKQIESLKDFKEFGITLNDAHYSLVWEKIKKRKDAILNKRTDAAQDVVDTLDNLDLIKANAHFTSKETLELIFEDKKEELHFSKAVIGTGSHSFIPKYAGSGADKIWTNSDFFEKMQLPHSLAIIGTGAIAIEFAMILSSLGVEIHLFGRKNKILENIDAEAAEYLFKKLKKNLKVTIHLSSNISIVDYANEQFEITFTQENKEQKINTTRVLSAAGRVANIEHLDLEKAGVNSSTKGITVSKHLQTSNPNIYANGDVVDGFPKFAHTAQYGAHTLAQNLFLEHNYFSVDYDINSWVLFSMPNVAMAGISEEQAKERGLDVIVDTFEFNTEAKSQIENEDYGFLKYIVDKKSNRIIGISIMHAEAQTMGGEAALIIANKLTLKDIIGSIHPHPTISEAYIMLAKKIMGDIMLKKLQNPVIKTLIDIERWL